MSNPHSDGATWEIQLRDACGTTSVDFMDRLLIDMMTGLSRKTATTQQTLNVALAALSGAEPQSEIEAMLVSQMTLTHSAALEMLNIARTNATVPAIQAAGGLAVKLLRTYTAQVEALAKLRRGGNQTVRVEHVHVYEGGQAIVGNVTTGGGGGHGGSADQPHAPGPEINGGALELESGLPVWGPDPLGGTMPVARGVGKDAMPDARRRKGQRGAQG
ncbi:MAG TPA: hypothetical protein VEA41_20180 [Salinarimonas sp.]|nr:hypothetical protein [Salinarimonas sp.]